MVSETTTSQGDGQLLEPFSQIAQAAGREIMKVYESADFEVSRKDDRSPLTKADRVAHDVIVSALGELSDLPVLSEESDPETLDKRRQWRRFWLVDPLDGTKDFIAKNGAFTVNIALIEDQRPTLGVIHIPAQGATYSAQKGKGVFRDGKPIKNTRANSSDFVAADSNFHSSEKMREFFQLNGIEQVKKIGSSIKFCAYAEGEIDVYPRLAPTCEWDTAAGQIIVEEAGGEVLDLTTQKPLLYNKDNIVNPYFIVTRKDLRWRFPAGIIKP